MLYLFVFIRNNFNSYDRESFIDSCGFSRGFRMKAKLMIERGLFLCLISLPLKKGIFGRAE